MRNMVQNKLMTELMLSKNNKKAYNLSETFDERDDYNIKVIKYVSED
jgi:hypothetical protein